jgi:hypothetical protein
MGSDAAETPLAAMDRAVSRALENLDKALAEDDEADDRA